jgi:hypothetical protein
MKSIEAVREELARVNDVLKEFRDPSTGGLKRSLTVQGLVDRQAHLLHEIKILEGGAPLEIRFVGGTGQIGKSIAVGLLADTLSELQLAIHSAAAAQIHGERVRFGPFRADVAAASTLRVTGFREGSFVVTLDGPQHRGAQLTVDQQQENPPFDEATLRVLNVIHSLQGDDAAAADLAVADLDSVRAVHHIRALAHAIAQRDTAVSIVDRGPFGIEPREVGIRLGGARKIVEALDATRQSISVTRYQGRLTGVRWSRATFDLELPDGRLISGRVVADLRERVQELFDRQVDAEIRTTTTRGRGGIRTSHALIGLPT